MQLSRYQVSTLRPSPIHSIAFSSDGRFFAVAGETGYELWRTFPLALVRRRALPGTLALALPLSDEPLLLLQGGGAAPLYSPNKAVVYHDGLGTAIAELEFGEKIRGVAARRGTICIALLRRTIAFTYTLSPAASPLSPSTNASSRSTPSARSTKGQFTLSKLGEWSTHSNPLGLLCLSTLPGSTLLALPGRQAGHVQLIHLPPCPTSLVGRQERRTTPAPYRSPIILAHTHELSTLSCSADGARVVTTSERGTLLRIWDTGKGRLERELRRGVDPAGMWGVVFEDAGEGPARLGEQGSREREGGRVVGWSDKGTIHVWGGLGNTTSTSRTSTPRTNAQTVTHLLSRNLPLPKYFTSQTSFAQYHLPRKNPHAFASYAAKAGVPSIKVGVAGDGDADGEEAERFVVGWIEVDDLGQARGDGHPGKVKERETTAKEGKEKKRLSAVGMGTREERGSFGSDGTSRTATPTFTAHAPAKVRTRMNDAEMIAGEKEGRGRGSGKEKQLVVISYSGDWYRLKLPAESVHADHDEHEATGMGVSDRGRNAAGEGRKGKCELVEYRRLGVGGGGW